MRAWAWVANLQLSGYSTDGLTARSRAGPKAKIRAATVKELIGGRRFLGALAHRELVCS